MTHLPILRFNYFSAVSSEETKEYIYVNLEASLDSEFDSFTIIKSC